MRLSMNVPHLAGPAETAAWAASMESAGVDVLWAGEAYGFDAVSMLGFLASRTSTVQLGSAILPVFSRSPALTAMTAAGLDFVSSGRFILGLGASGPQVVRSWYGVPYERPLERTRDDRGVPVGVGARDWTTRGRPSRYLGRQRPARLPIDRSSSWTGRFDPIFPSTWPRWAPRTLP